MDTLFAWYNLVFYIPLTVGILLALGTALGIADVPQGIDLDGDGVPDVWVGGEVKDGDFKALSVLGFGKVPILLIVMNMCLIFGGVGTMMNLLLVTDGMAKTLVSFGAASVATVFLTRVFGRLLARLMPTLETTSTLRTDLVGCTGTLILDCDSSSGVAQIRRDGDVYQITCRSDAPIAKGNSVLITEYDEEANRYDVCLDPMTK